MKRYKHSLSAYNLFSCKMGQLIPFGIWDVLPGDTFQHASSAFIRLSPLVAPVMHPVRVRIHHWFVPLRLVWDDFEKFITGGPDGMDASVFPTVSLTYSAGPPETGTGIVGSLADYLGVNPDINNQVVSALPFRAYQKIYNEFYRDQDLTAEAVIDTTSGPDTTTDLDLQFAAWEKDYFTSARPFTQKGPVVSIPLTGDAPVTGFGKQTQSYATGPQNAYETDGTGTTAYAKYRNIQPSAADTNFFVEEDPNNAGFPNVRADLSGVTAANINDLRLAFALQRYEEARARYGSRYTEYLRYLGVRSSDARLQRPEYLGGGRQTIQFSEVLQTSPTEDEPVGSLKGHGIAAMRSNRYRRFFEEHGFVISLISILPKTIYAQATPRLWNRRTKEDFWQRELQHIGQQEILNKELYAPHSTPDGIFGYQDRYDEYRRSESRVSGQFRKQILDYWHMARIFSSNPTLNSSFVVSNPTDRIFADQTGNDTLYIMGNHSLQARRQVAASGNSFIF